MVRLLFVLVLAISLKSVYAGKLDVETRELIADMQNASSLLDDSLHYGPSFDVCLNSSTIMESMASISEGHVARGADWSNKEVQKLAKGILVKSRDIASMCDQFNRTI